MHDFGKQITIDLRETKLGHAWFWEANQRRIWEDLWRKSGKITFEKEEKFYLFWEGINTDMGKNLSCLHRDFQMPCTPEQ